MKNKKMARVLVAILLACMIVSTIATVVIALVQQ